MAQLVGVEAITPETLKDVYYRRMYADTGIATDSARVAWSTR
jgi:hypothetical protein